YNSLETGTPVPVPIADAVPVVDWVERVARVADREHIENVSKYKLSDSIPVLVTGASGAVGSAVVERLRTEGIPVRIFVRRPPAEIPAGVEIALGDLGDPVAVDKAVKGAQIVIHAGAAMKGGWIEHKCATVVGTQNVLDACKKHCVKKLVHIS